ncbi:hypothetical protein ILUMI_19718 [Ignelater luminosus]|uniref:Glucose-methanol-choline oxidoreductase N-terminal domain-containing protein n=1 Tax=Ignelater luminosus TaxID=2038154 RepID=A0A8K0G580_IGNLU|nr:hypothetical protein ILUMI_19718 [Ignelater luminosus]
MKIIFCFLLLAVFAQAKDVSEETVQYYLKLLQDFMINSTKYEYPTDNRRFFQLINEEAEPIYHGHYDFIIVGAGAGGSVLTNRLTKTGKFKVLVIEAGGREDDFTDVPGFAAFLARSDFNWGYKTIPQKKCCLGFKNKQCNYPRGRAVGGSTVINFMMYVRGNKKDFEKWGSENPGWDYKSVLPYFKKSENSSLRQEDSGYHGHYGPLSVEDCRHYPDATRMFLEAAEQRGRKILDYNGKDQYGYSTLQIMTKEGTRYSASKAFVESTTGRKNLELLDHALGTKILIKNREAYGVEFIRNGKKFKATASKEVIISGGSINSPQILMLSGIGPKEHLEELGIPVVQKLPVGNTLRDHQVYPALIFSTNISPSNETSIEEQIRLYLQGSGVLTSAAGITGLGFESPKLKSKNPHFEVPFASLVLEQATQLYLDLLEMTEENWQALSNNLSGKYVWMAMPFLLHPKSKGTIKLKTKDPLDFPILDSNLYSDENGDDMKEMLAVIEDVFEMSKTPAFQKIDSKYLSDPLPACKNYKHLSSDYWRCAVEQATYPILHAVSTCAMGPKDDENAVVDNKLKVHGIDRLRVVDASVIPFSLAGHPTAVVYMIAEKAADLIRKQYKDL